VVREILEVVEDDKGRRLAWVKYRIHNTRRWKIGIRECGPPDERHLSPASRRALESIRAGKGLPKGRGRYSSLEALMKMGLVEVRAL